MMNIQSHQITHRAMAVRVVTRPVSVVNATMSSSDMLCVSIPESGRVGMSVTLSKYADDPSQESQKLVMSYTRYEDGWDARLTVEGVGDFDVDALGHPMYPTPDALYFCRTCFHPSPSSTTCTTMC